MVHSIAVWWYLFGGLVLDRGSPSHPLYFILLFGLRIFLVMIGWAVIGMMCQFYGLLYLFGQFLPIAADSMKSTPVIGDILSHPTVERLLGTLSGAAATSTPSRRPPV